MDYPRSRTVPAGAAGVEPGGRDDHGRGDDAKADRCGRGDAADACGARA
jgi:hypothetical protein